MRDHTAIMGRPASAKLTILSKQRRGWRSGGVVYADGGIHVCTTPHVRTSTPHTAVRVLYDFFLTNEGCWKKGPNCGGGLRPHSITCSKVAACSKTN